MEGLQLNERDKSAKRESILDAAVTEIAAHGYYNTTVAMIARRAQVADGTIYLYFKGKHDLLVAIFRRSMERFTAIGERAVTSAGGPAARLKRLVELHLALLGADRDLAVITQIELRHSVHFMHEFSEGPLRPYLELIAGVLIDGCRSRVFRCDLDPVLAAKAVFGVLDEMVTDWVLSHREARLTDRVPAVTELVMAMVKAN